MTSPVVLLAVTVPYSSRPASPPTLFTPVTVADEVTALSVMLVLLLVLRPHA